MLNIYVGEDNKPNNCIDDVELAFTGVLLKDCKFVKDVLENIEQGHYASTTSFIDRFGRTLFADCLSTGSKILLEVNSNREYTFSGNEMGYNCIPFLVNLCEGGIYFDEFNYKMVPFPAGWSCQVNDQIVNSSYEFMEVVDEV